jgi:hypothetical protein
VVGAHLWKRLAPGTRAAWANAGKGLVTVGVLAGVVLMVMGYRGRRAHRPLVSARLPDPCEQPADAVRLLPVCGQRHEDADHRVIRHPQLTAVKTWAVAHLLVNGDLASVVLFGGILAWAVVSVILINRAEPRPGRPEPAPVGKEIGAVVGAVVVMGVVMLIHNWLGVPPWG